MSESSENAEMKLVDNHVNQLLEHFDTVQIFASRHAPTTHDGTVRMHSGAGNWFARYGQVRDWIVMQEERMRIVVRKEAEE